MIAASAFAADEFVRIGAPAVHRVPLGVDLVQFHPLDPASEHRGPVTLVCTGRLSREKQPHVAIDTARELVRRGVAFELLMIGDGPERAALERSAAGLPVRFLGHVHDRWALSLLLRHAAIGLATCPYETFGLAALETLASGTPVVAPAAGALAELLSPGPELGVPGLAVSGGALEMADAVVALLGRDHERHRSAARRRAERYSWSATATAFERVLRSEAVDAALTHGSNDSPPMRPERSTLRW